MCAQRRSPRGGSGAPYAARSPRRHRARASRRTPIAPPQPAVPRPASPSLASVRGSPLVSPPRSRLPPLASPPSAARGLHPHGSRAGRLPPTLLSLAPPTLRRQAGQGGRARLIQPLPSLTSLPSAPAFPRAASLAGWPAAAAVRPSPNPKLPEKDQLQLHGHEAMHRSVLELDRGRSSGQPQQCLAMGITR